MDIAENLSIDKTLKSLNRRQSLRALQEFAGIILDPKSVKKIAEQYMRAAKSKTAIRMHYITSVFRLLELELRAQADRQQPVVINLHTSILGDAKGVITIKPKDVTDAGHVSETVSNDLTRDNMSASQRCGFGD